MFLELLSQMMNFATPRLTQFKKHILRLIGPAFITIFIFNEVGVTVSCLSGMQQNALPSFLFPLRNESLAE